MWHVLPNDVYGSTHVNVWTAASIAAALPSFIPNVTSKTGAIVSLAAALMAIHITYYTNNIYFHRFCYWSLSGDPVYPYKIQEFTKLYPDNSYTTSTNTTSTFWTTNDLLGL
ncbi:hypothetical protein [Clostridium estertheticum]|uniref:hypothetical protein n=1 Tax=Clostridium estertheticum TaxID=238834 RepID=UPI001CF52CC7|nr:hypothetical protein [Clostridium estertheticum]MCB2342848.1 hypothetical protein [Clostridium estertheticum]